MIGDAVLHHCEGEPCLATAYGHIRLMLEPGGIVTSEDVFTIIDELRSLWRLGLQWSHVFWRDNKPHVAVIIPPSAYGV